MYSFLMKPGVVDVNPIGHTVAAIKPEENYSFFTYKKNTPTTVEYRGTPYPIQKGTRFGVRPSSNGKFIRLIFKDEPNRVFTITLDQANKLAKSV